MNAILQHLMPGDRSTLLSNSTVVFLLVAANLTIKLYQCYGLCSQCIIAGGIFPSNHLWWPECLVISRLRFCIVMSCWRRTLLLVAAAFDRTQTCWPDGVCAAAVLNSFCTLCNTHSGVYRNTSNVTVTIFTRCSTLLSSVFFLFLDEISVCFAP